MSINYQVMFASSLKKKTTNKWIVKKVKECAVISRKKDNFASVTSVAEKPLIPCQLLIKYPTLDVATIY